MIFEYFEFAPHIFRPVIPVILQSQTKLMLYAGLIDSGADYCIFSLDVADLLGIKIQPESKTKFIGVGKDIVEGYWSEVTIRIGEVTYKTPVIFAKITDFGHGILGQKGFFDHFDVKLSYHKQMIEIESI